jgi:putative hydrolase of the HAD superfamily
MIDAAVFSCVFGVRKPDPRIYQTAADRLGVRLQNCVYVGDGGSQELSGALSMGMHPVFINVPSEEKADISFIVEEWHGPAISSLKEILDLIE